MELVVIAVIALVGFWLFLFVFKRALRMALRLAVLGAVVLALLAGAFAWWWYSSPSERTPPPRTNAPRQARPAR
jgi:hypothetical protein